MGGDGAETEGSRRKEGELPKLQADRLSSP